jgi:cysteine-rich repeat protein
MAVANNELTMGASEAAGEAFTQHACGASNAFGYESAFGSGRHWKNSNPGQPILTGNAGNAGACNPNDAAAWERFYLGPSSCSGSTPPGMCGDGTVNGSEQCDDGNTNNTDGCLNNCRLSICGDGVVRSGVEQCDDGNTSSGDGCDALCRIETTSQCQVAPLNRVAAVSSSNENGGLLPAYAIDGNHSTRWASAFVDPSWIYVDLGAPRSIDTVVLDWEAAASSRYDIRISNDAVNWITVYTEQSGNGGVDTITGLNAVGRYVRMHSFSRTTQWGNSLYEFEVHGDPDPNCQ